MEALRSPLRQRRGWKPSFCLARRGWSGLSSAAARALGDKLPAQRRTHAIPSFLFLEEIIFYGAENKIEMPSFQYLSLRSWYLTPENLQLLVDAFDGRKDGQCGTEVPFVFAMDGASEPIGFAGLFLDLMDGRGELRPEVK